VEKVSTRDLDIDYRTVPAASDVHIGKLEMDVSGRDYNKPSDPRVTDALCKITLRAPTG
jgi:hypothetical protein